MEIDPKQFTEVQTSKEYVRLIADFKEKGAHTEPFDPGKGFLGFVAEGRWYGIDARNLQGWPSLPSEISVLQSMLEWSPEKWREKRAQAKAEKETG